MSDPNDFNFLVDPPSDLDAKVFAKVAPVLKENKQIHGRKQWLQLWIPVASTAALTAFSFWFLNKKIDSTTGIPDKSKPDSLVTNNSTELDLQLFAAMEMDEDSLELAGNLDVIEELDLLEMYSEDGNS